MSNPKRISRVRGFKALVLSSVIACAALASGAGAASAAPVQLQWTQVNVSDSAAPPNTNRTWLGYITKSGCGPGCANGSATPSNGAGGTAVTPGSERGADKLFNFTFDAAAAPATLAGTFNFKGTLTYASGPHSINIAINDPSIVLNGDGSGSLIASGTGISPNPMAPGYNPSDPDYATYNALTIFSLDLKAATCTLGGDGVRTLSNIVPALAAPKFFTGSYAVGAGPDRTPATFGTLSIVGAPCADADLKNVKHRSLKFKKRLFRSHRTLNVRVTQNNQFVGFGTVKERKAKVMFIGEKLTGSYKLTPIKRDGTRNPRYKTTRITLR